MESSSLSLCVCLLVGLVSSSLGQGKSMVRGSEFVCIFELSMVLHSNPYPCLLYSSSAVKPIEDN